MSSVEERPDFQAKKKIHKEREAPKPVKEKGPRVCYLQTAELGPVGLQHRQEKLIRDRLLVRQVWSWPVEGDPRSSRRELRGQL